MSKKILHAVLETARDLHKAGVMGTKTMRDFDVLCLPPMTDGSTAQIKRLRTKNKADKGH